VAVLGARSNKQRQEIAAKYQQKYNKVKFISQRSQFPVPIFSRTATGFHRQAKRFNTKEVPLHGPWDMVKPGGQNYPPSQYNYPVPSPQLNLFISRFVRTKAASSGS